jgi:hypothetical protein
MTKSNSIKKGQKPDTPAGLTKKDSSRNFGQKGQSLAKKDRGRRHQKSRDQNTKQDKSAALPTKFRAGTASKIQGRHCQQNSGPALPTKFRAGTDKRKTKRSALSEMSSGGHCQKELQIRQKTLRAAAPKGHRAASEKGHSQKGQRPAQPERTQGGTARKDRG